MKTKTYDIEFTGLKLGFHDYSFDIATDIFKDSPYDDLKFTSAKATCKLEKKENVMELLCSIESSLEFNCDRCGELYPDHMAFEEKLIIKAGTEKMMETDDILILSPNDHKIELKDLFYEWIIVHLPIQRIHPEDEDGEPTCSPEKLARVQQMLSSDDDNEDQIDERWSQLKDLLTKK